MIIKARCMSVLFVIYTITQNVRWTSAELFTAISEVESLLETHKRIIDDLDNYIAKEEKVLAVLKKQLNLYTTEHMLAMEDVPNYLGNPINAFTLIKRLTTDLDVLERKIKFGTGYATSIKVNHSDVIYPTLEDLTGAAQALTRLQETYHLDIGDLAEGRLNGVAYSTPMTADDCYELGRTLYNEKDFANGLRWMTESLRKFKEQDDAHNFTEVDILEYIALLHNLLGDVEQALNWTNKLLTLDPNHQRARGNVVEFTKIIQEKQQGIGKTGEADDKKESPQPTLTKENIYESLCRGEMELPQQIKRKLKCRYLTENHPFLKLAPIKMEQVYIEPDIYIFHQVMSDNEIEHIKELAKPRLKRAVTVDTNTGNQVTVNFRICKSGWLFDTESPVVARVSQRVADFTGLSMETAEGLQVANYGIGGHYEPHLDFTKKSDFNFKTSLDNRIATVLFYMSDVAEGGATVFTKLGLSVFPVKNAAIFWMNLHPSGEGDFATMHAACPVLRGSKWVANKWIHSSGQEFIRPCNLEYQREEDIREFPVPLKLQ